MRYFLILLIALLTACGAKDGKDGAPGAPGPKGEQGAKGDKGEQGAKGDKGEQGAKGDKGEQGAQGVDGAEGESFAQAATKFLSNTKQYEASVLDIQCNDGSKFWRGTGTKVVGGILTAHHVTDGATACTYWSGSVLVGGGGTLQQDGVRDQVLIVSPSWNAAGQELSEVPVRTDYEPTLGEMLLLLSLPADIDSDIQFTFGLVTAELVPVGTYWNNTFTTDMAAAGGSSGGPVFDREGNVVAIHVGGYEGNGLELNYTLPIR